MDGQSASQSLSQSPILGPRPDFYYCQTTAVLSMWGALSGERGRVCHCNVVLCRARKPNWLALSRSITSIWLWTIFRIAFSKSFPVVDKRFIGRKFWGNFGSYRVSVRLFFASLWDVGKYDNWRQRLNKCVKYSSGLLGRCLRHSFGTP
jgi:hypothetical protein